ncbi:hypothetical protein [Erwinia mallotivora]|uniref:Uncharacterized protein n=1 Tax=Erwinia mallotivora TaxID=69222 RepID=A0A014ND49_9GAMM|nr:hypothetical protein [Erwinia mallotivora]EXU77328.1 hypothetical protein BG55_00600 [Erwinia mallotivora]
MDMFKKIKIKYHINGEEITDTITPYDHNKYDQVIEFLVQKYVPTKLIESQLRQGERNQISKRNLIENGISEVSYYEDEDDVWVGIPDLNLKKV